MFPRTIFLLELEGIMPTFPSVVMPSKITRENSSKAPLIPSILQVNREAQFEALEIYISVPYIQRWKQGRASGCAYLANFDIFQYPNPFSEFGVLARDSSEYRYGSVIQHFHTRNPEQRHIIGLFQCILPRLNAVQLVSIDSIYRPPWVESDEFAVQEYCFLGAVSKNAQQQL